MAFLKPVNRFTREKSMSQNTTKAKPIKAVGGYNKKSPTENLASANAVHSGIFTDPADYPTPPIDELTFKGAIDTLSAKITAALDGGKKAIADRNHQGPYAGNELFDSGPFVRRCVRVQRLERSGYPYLYLVD